MLPVAVAKNRNRNRNETSTDPLKSVVAGMMQYSTSSSNFHAISCVNLIPCGCAFSGFHFSISSFSVNVLCSWLRANHNKHADRWWYCLYCCSYTAKVSSVWIVEVLWSSLALELLDIIESMQFRWRRGEKRERNNLMTFPVPINFYIS